MAKITSTLSGNGDVEIGRVRRNRDRQVRFYKATISIYGTFGGGTATLKMSSDGGTTKYALKDAPGSSGSDITYTANGSANIELGFSDDNDTEFKLYVSLAGATDPEITIDVFDCN